LYPKNFGILEWFSHLKFSTNATSPNIVAAKCVTSESISQDLALHNYFKFLSSDEQKAQGSWLTILIVDIVESILTDIFLQETN